jgi:hypothetical protein
MCIICIGVVSVVNQYNCVYYCDTCYIQQLAYRPIHDIERCIRYDTRDIVVSVVSVVSV